MSEAEVICDHNELLVFLSENTGVQFHSKICIICWAPGSRTDAILEPSGVPPHKVSSVYPPFGGGGKEGRWTPKSVWFPIVKWVIP